MLELVSETIQALQAETLTYPQGVQVWMKVMGLSFLASIFFAYRKVGARWILAALLLNLSGLLVGKIIFPEASRADIGTFVHIVFWLPILAVVWLPQQRFSFRHDISSAFDRIYAVWLCWSSGLMAVSLVIDLRNAFLILVTSQVG